jgi:branched-chain amino acid transport system permease protein
MDYILSQAINVGIFILLSMSLNLINGFCGQFSLGHAGFWGLGAYASAIYSTNFPLPIDPNLNLVISMFFGFIVAALAGFIVGLPTLRLKGDYLAIATLGFSEIVRIIIMNTEAVGGPRGFINIPKWANVYWIYASVILLTIFMVRIKNSKIGRAIISIREDEIAAETMGVNLFHYKIFSFVVGAGFAGVAGSLFAHIYQYLHPSNFTFMWSVVILTMIIFGGLGSISGSIIGAVVLTLFPEALRFFGKEISELRMVLFSLLLIVLMLVRPQGIFGGHEFSIFKSKKSGNN